MKLMNDLKAKAGWLTPMTELVPPTEQPPTQWILPQ
jgi:hypothetical protein